MNIYCGMIAPALALVALLQGAPASAQQDTTPATVTGRWVLNVNDSHDPRRTLPGARRWDSTGAHSRGMPRAGGSAGVPGGPPRPPTPRAVTAQRTLLALALEPPATLQLLDGDTTVAVVWADRDSVRLSPNGRKVERRTEDSVVIEYRARHRDNRLQVERRVRDGGRIIETFYLSRGGRQLYVLTEVVGSEFPLHFRRVYDPSGP